MPTTPPLRRAARRVPAYGGRRGRGAGGRRGHGLHAARDRRRAPARPRAVTRSPDTDPDVALAATVLADEQAMLDRVLATVRRHPRLGDHAGGGPDRAHRARRPADRGRAAGRRRPRRPRPSVALASPRRRRRRRTRVPARAAAALAALAREEDGLSLLGRRSAFAAESGAFARVLASMAAAAAQQARALADAAGAGPMTPLEALQQTLAGEHAAVYVYRALGRPGVDAPPTRTWRAGWRRRTPCTAGAATSWSTMVRAASGDPVAADVSYQLPNPSRTPAQLTVGCAGDRAALLGRLRDDGRQHVAGEPAVGHRRAHRLGRAAAGLRRRPGRVPRRARALTSSALPASGQREDPPHPRTSLGRGGSARRKGPRESAFPRRVPLGLGAVGGEHLLRPRGLVRGELVVAGVVAVVHVVVDRVEARQRAGVASLGAAAGRAALRRGVARPRRSCSCSRPGRCGRARTSGRPRARRSCPRCSWWPSRPAARSTAPGCRRWTGSSRSPTGTSRCPR